MVINHMKSITANDSHAHDDIADNFYDAVKLGLIDKVISGINYELEKSKKQEATARILMGTFHKLQSIETASNWI
jgi:hypothetical protein